MSLFNNPHQWAASMVATWLRFWFFAAFLAGALAYLVYLASSRGVGAAWGLAFFLAVFQLGTLYALRKILLGPPRQWS